MKTQLARIFSERLQFEIEERRILKSELATQCGISPSRITRLLKGETINLDIIERVASALGVHPLTLLLENTHGA